MTTFVVAHIDSQQDILLSLRVVLVLPEGIKVNAGVWVCRRGRDVGGVYAVLGQAMARLPEPLIQNQNKFIEI